MANSNPPKKNQAFTTSICLSDFTNAGSFKASPTIASGDFKISKDGAALANLTNIPTNDPSGSIWVTIDLTSTEMNADRIQIQCIDQTSPKEWADYAFTIMTSP